jgi:paraquat-inducible protein A
MSSSSLIACHECDVLQRETVLPIGGVARCIRCEAVLYRCPHYGLDLSLAFTLGAALLFMLANIYPLMTLEARGAVNSATLFDTVRGLYNQDRPLVASLVLVTAILVPAASIIGMMYLLLPLRLGWIPRGFRLVFRMIRAIRPWGMTEVFMLGALVSLAKLTTIADVTPDIGLWAFGALMMLLAAGTASFEPCQLWGRVAEIEQKNRSSLNAPVEAT